MRIKPYFLYGSSRTEYIQIVEIVTIKLNLENHVMLEIK